MNIHPAVSPEKSMTNKDGLVLITFPTSKSHNKVYFYLPYVNSYLRREMTSFLKNIPQCNVIEARNKSCLFIEWFEKSLGCSIINSYQDFNDHVFWLQVTYYKNICKHEGKHPKLTLKMLIKFYRYLINSHSEHTYFDNSLHLSEALLFSTYFWHFVEEDFQVLPYGYNGKWPEGKRFVFLLRGYESESTRIKLDDYFPVDLKGLSSTILCQEIIHYLLNVLPLAEAIWTAKTNYLRDLLAMLEKVKSKPGYPNPRHDYYTIPEAIILKTYCSKKNVALGTMNNKIGCIRRFLLWEHEERHVLTFEKSFFDYLRQYEEPSKTSGNTIPDEHLGKISAHLADKSPNDHIANLTYAVMHIALETELRLSQILHLPVDCLHPSSKPHEYVLKYYHKTGHGEKGAFVITELTYRHLMRIISDTEFLRENCNRKQLKNYIFLFYGENQSVNLLSTNKFLLCFQNCCSELGLPKYTSRHLRDTHMTKAFEYVLRHGKSDLVMAKLSKHKYLDTTKSHYIEKNLQAMLEATYGVIIGSLDDCFAPTEHIKDSIPATADCKETIVAHGCGNCTATACHMKNSLPCLVCKDFITTIEHEPYFQHAIEDISKLIKQASTKHDKDDLITIKLLMVMYLKAIYEKKDDKS